jgi:membrane-bound serine protease (ClpP class)
LGLLAWRACVVVGVACAVAGEVNAQEVPALTALMSTVAGPITPVIAGHIDDGIARAEREGAAAYLIQLDTPGGLDTSMRAIVQDILASEVPVIVYISPQGARGASAGAIIAFAAHVAAMAPGTAIGAATPVSGGGGDDLDAKAVNDAIAYATALAELRGRDVEFIADTVREGRSASASEALELGAIDLVARSVDELLETVDGMTVDVGPTARAMQLHTAGATVEQHDLGVMRTIQQFLADPNIAFLLLSIGTLGLIYELATPGLGVGGALGVTFIVLAMFGLAVLPVDVVGIMFLVLAAVLFVAEVAAPGIGLAAAGGALAMVLSGIFLIDDAPGIEISAAVIVPSALVVGVFVVIAGRIAMRSRVAPASTTGPGLFVGRQATVRLGSAGAHVFMQGGWWGIRPAEPDVVVADGSRVEVVGMDGLTLVVDALPAAVGISTKSEAPGEPEAESEDDGGPL